MAVVQISRIQVRRGKANVGTGTPQLASGELGWAIDTQELFIGNGSISEGAPEVNNTKILTEHSDILGLAGTYAYKNEASSTARTIQEKLDDVVSLRDFIDPTKRTTAQSIQLAVDTLFLSGSKTKRTTLLIPAGEYTIDSIIYVPPFARIVGEGKDSTYIISSGGHAFQTVNGTSIAGTPADPSTTTNINQARNILIKDMSIVDSTLSGTILMYSAKNCIIENVEFVGNFNPVEDNPYVNDDIAQGFKEWIGIKLQSLSDGVTCDNNKFENCTFKNYVSPVYSDYDIINNNITYSSFVDSWFGVVFGLTTNPSTDTPGQLSGPSNNTISNCDFNSIHEEAILIREGINNTSSKNKFYSVGNHSGNSATATTPIIRFGYKNTETSEARYDPKFHVGNNSIDDYFERTQDLTVNPAYNTGDYPPEVEGAKYLEIGNQIQTRLGTSANNTVAVADISQANPCVVRTVTDHNFSNGQVVLLTGLVGMTELEGRSFYINVVDSDEFELYLDEGLTSGEDSSAHTAYGSDGAAVGAFRTYFMQLPADQRRGTIIVDYVYNGTMSSNEINRKGSWTVMYDIDENTISFTDSHTSTGNTFYAEQLDFTATLDAANYKVTFSFTNTGFSLGSDIDNFRFTVKYTV